MKLDKDLVRQIPLAIEASETNAQETISLVIEPWTKKIISYHVMLLHEAGLVKADDVSYLEDDFFVWAPQRLTYQDHEFLDTVRDEEIWRRTKARAEKAGGAGLGLLLEIGKAYGKQMFKERLGIELP